MSRRAFTYSNDYVKGMWSLLTQFVIPIAQAVLSGLVVLVNGGCVERFLVLQGVFHPHSVIDVFLVKQPFTHDARILNQMHIMCLGEQKDILDLELQPYVT